MTAKFREYACIDKTSFFFKMNSHCRSMRRVSSSCLFHLVPLLREKKICYEEIIENKAIYIKQRMNHSNMSSWPFGHGRNLLSFLVFGFQFFYFLCLSLL
jgi:hypothetical protein